jgi:NAD(P)-dependent dehydrogenase (short-subunit alcohol dehydrogenase family)
MIDLTSKVAIVTGAAGGIGGEAAATLLHCGASVIVTDIDRRKIEEAASALSAHGKVIGLDHDVTDPADWVRVIKAADDLGGRLDILVNNAGTMLGKPLMETTLDEFRQSYRVNAESIFIGMQAAVPLMERTAQAFDRTTSIINLSSIYGQVASRMHAAYSASKGAVRMLSKAAAMELVGKGIRVNSVHPGPVATGLSRSTFDTLIRLGLVKSDEEALTALAGRIPMGRLGDVSEIAGVIVFLASDLSRYMTGSEITVDGGFTAM